MLLGVYVNIHLQKHSEANFAGLLMSPGYTWAQWLRCSIGSMGWRQAGSEERVLSLSEWVV